jgi:hypothetical protein
VELPLELPSSTGSAFAYEIVDAEEHTAVRDWTALKRFDYMVVSDSPHQSTPYDTYDFIDVKYIEGEGTEWAIGKGLLLEIRQDPLDASRTHFVFAWIYDRETTDIPNRLKDKTRGRYIASNHFDVYRTDRFGEVQNAVLRGDVILDQFLDRHRGFALKPLSKDTPCCISEAVRVFLPTVSMVLANPQLAKGVRSFGGC